MASIHWFRKGLRLHDNPSLLDACARSSKVYPVFILDPMFATSEVVGVNRYAFLLQSLLDLDTSLRRKGSRLYVVRGKPLEQLPILFRKWNIKLLTFEKDTEPYAIQRDREVISQAKELNIEVIMHSSHTLHEMEAYLLISRSVVPKSYGSFVKLFSSLPDPNQPIDAPALVKLIYIVRIHIHIHEII